MRCDRLCRVGTVAVVAFVGVLPVGRPVGRPVFAGGVEGAVSLGPVFYSGKTNETLTPQYGLDVAYHSAQLLSRAVNWTHRFDLGLLISGTRIADRDLSYQGISGSYTTGLRVNFSAQGVLPYVEVGPALGIFALYTSGGTSNDSRSQTSMKYGYMIGTGFDKESGARGSGGWGVGVNFFDFLPSPSMFEFPAGAVSAKGVRLDLKILIGTGN